MRRLLCALGLVALLTACNNTTGGGSVGTDVSQVPSPSGTPGVDLSTPSSGATP